MLEPRALELESMMMEAQRSIDLFATASFEPPLIAQVAKAAALRGIRKRVLVCSAVSDPKRRIASPEVLSRAFVEQSWEVQLIMESETHHALEYLLVDDSIALVAGGHSLMGQAPNTLVEVPGIIDNLSSHFDRYWSSRAYPPGAEARLLFKDVLLSAAPELSAGLSVVSEGNWEEIIAELSRNPDDIFNMSPRQFEELVAHLLSKQGFNVELTPTSRDGGKDILIAVPQSLGDFLYLVECKRYARGRPVGVRRVRELFGVVAQEQATAGLLITTSTFTKAAIAFQQPIRRRLALEDYATLNEWLKCRSPILGPGRVR